MAVEPGNDLGLLFLSTKAFPDFTLRLEFQLGRIDVNSGIFVRFQKGKTTEYHAELVPEDNHSDFEVIWVVGVSVHIVRGRNLVDVRIFKNQYRRYSLDQ